MKDVCETKFKPPKHFTVDRSKAVLLLQYAFGFLLSSFVHAVIDAVLFL